MVTSLNPPWIMAASALVAAAPAAAQAETHRFHQDHVLGASLDIVVVGAEPDAAARAAAAARAEIDRLDVILSGWRTDSELSRLNTATQPLAVSRELFEVIAACEAWRRSSDGAFSARLGSLEALWRTAESKGVAPSRAALKHAAARADDALVGLAPLSLTITRPEGVLFAPDALAKGYVIDRALEAARAAAPEARGLLLDIGGDLRCWGDGPSGDWRIGLAHGSDPEAPENRPALALRGKAVATSGPGARDRLIAGRRHSHLLSPRDGTALAATVTVVGDRAADADALATALAAMAPADGLSWARGLPGMEARIVGADGRIDETPGWSRLAYRRNEIPLLVRTAAAKSVAKPPVKPAPKAAPVDPAAWPAGFGVKVEVNLLPATGRGKEHWPFVVIWVSDAQGKLVRTISAWGDRRSYVGENWVWWRAFLAKYKYDDMDMFTRPSRPAGAYTVVWDGKDDDGKPVPVGRYTIGVDYVREDGPRVRQSIPVDLGRQPAVANAPANDELGPTTVRYAKIR